jgi:hypothetical protein
LSDRRIGLIAPLLLTVLAHPENGFGGEQMAEGVRELDQDKLTPLLRLKYNNSISDAIADLGRPGQIGEMFSGFQQYLYKVSA